jgi:hypothetical protein
MSISIVPSRVREPLAERRRQRRARLALARELAEFRTPAERLELEAMIERHEAMEHEVRRFRGELDQLSA